MKHTFSGLKFHRNMAVKLLPLIIIQDAFDRVHVACQQSQFVMANSRGFMAGFPTSRHYLSCAVIAEENGRMERDDWYASERDAKDLAKPAAIGDYAARRALIRRTVRGWISGRAIDVGCGMGGRSCWTYWIMCCYPLHGRQTLDSLSVSCARCWRNCCNRFQWKRWLAICWSY